MIAFLSSNEQISRGQPQDWLVFSTLNCLNFLHGFRKRQKHPIPGLSKVYEGWNSSRSTWCILLRSWRRPASDTSPPPYLPPQLASCATRWPHLSANAAISIAVLHKSPSRVYISSQHRDETCICSVSSQEKKNKTKTAVQKLSSSYWNTGKIIPIFSKVLQTIRKPNKITYVHNYAASPWQTDVRCL